VLDCTFEHRTGPAEAIAGIEQAIDLFVPSRVHFSTLGKCRGLKSRQRRALSLPKPEVGNTSAIASTSEVFDDCRTQWVTRLRGLMGLPLGGSLCCGSSVASPLAAGVQRRSDFYFRRRVRVFAGPARHGLAGSFLPPSVCGLERSRQPRRIVAGKGAVSASCFRRSRSRRGASQRWNRVWAIFIPIREGERGQIKSALPHRMHPNEKSGPLPKICQRKNLPISSADDLR
jgi:hypothetical protein